MRKAGKLCSNCLLYTSLSYTMMSKRKLQQLVAEKIVEGWDDPRMPTLSGMRRRGYTPAAIREF